MTSGYRAFASSARAFPTMAASYIPPAGRQLMSAPLSNRHASTCRVCFHVSLASVRYADGTRAQGRPLDESLLG